MPIVVQRPGSAIANFSFREIPSGSTITIPVNQQMVVFGGILIEGELDIEGQLVLEV